MGIVWVGDIQPSEGVLAAGEHACINFWLRVGGLFWAI